MPLNERAINSINEYLAELAQSAVNIAFGESNEDSTFEEFMESLTHYLHLLASEHVATEVLTMSSNAIEQFNGGSGMTVADVQALIELKENGIDDDDEIDYIDE